MADQVNIHNQERQTKKKNFNFYLCHLTSLQANLVFALIGIAGQVGQNVTLPLWLSASQTNRKQDHGAKMDAYFVLSFSCVFFVVAFGLMLAFLKVFYPHKLGDTEKQFSHKLLFAVGLCDCLNGVLVVFASPPNRTAPYLQAILGNFMIPLTIVAR